jgi:TPR repeat protein
MLSPQEREAAEKMVARGERDLADGNVASARQFFLRAATAGLARGALLLAATYDPQELARLGVVGLQPNLPEARKWYERAQELGAPEARERLARLAGG